ncbi:MAG: dUTP diphosphatase [Bacteroidia bacterium]|nr:dUTP diphosphatase [Bacteroidia bacterium]
MLEVKIRNEGNHPLPAYQTVLSAGMDLHANIEAAVELAPGKRVLIPTGLFIELPEGYEAQIRPRSGLAYKHGITVLNSPGTIDADYRGEIKILLINLGEENFVIQNGERIAQMVVASHANVEWKAIDTLTETERGAGGYGHSGK